VKLNEMVYDPKDRLVLEFRREYALDDAIMHTRKKFDAKKSLKVIILVFQVLINSFNSRVS
jgi:hypothetical protein